MSKVRPVRPHVGPLTNHNFLPHYTDEDLAAMYLSDKKNGITRDLNDHEELEVLLESFSKQVEEIVNEAENTQVRFKRRAFQRGR